MHIIAVNLATVISRHRLHQSERTSLGVDEDRPDLVAAVRPLLEARNAVEQQVSELDRKVMKLARRDAQVQRFMTVPGVGPITALAFKATIDDPARFARSRSVGAYVGLTSRRHVQARLTGVVASRSVVMPCCAVIYSKPPGFC